MRNLKRSKSPILDSIVKANRNINRANRILSQVFNSKAYEPGLSLIKEHNFALQTRDRLLEIVEQCEKTQRSRGED
jgi:hypothetical protein